MSSEYVKLSIPEVTYARKNFLKAQLDVLDIVKHYLTYQNLRKREFMLKIDLKNKIENIDTNVSVLQKILPKTYNQESEEKQKVELEGESKEVNSLQYEIDLIKKKLALLR